MITFKKVSLRSLLPVLMIRTSRTDLENFLPQIADLALMAMRKIVIREGVLHFVENVKVDIENEMGLLPPGFYKLGKIKRCGIGSCGCDDVVSSCSCNSEINCTCGYQYYRSGVVNYYIEDCYIRAPYRSGSVQFSFFQLSLDAEGYPLIPEDYSDAVMRYIAATFKEGELAAKRIQTHEFTMFKQMWEEQAIIARSTANTADDFEREQARILNNSPYKYFLNSDGNSGYYAG